MRKQASEEFIQNEQMEFLKTILPIGDFSPIPTSSIHDMSVELISPKNDLTYWEWIRASFLGTFVTWWNNGLDFDTMFDLSQKENLLLQMLKSRPISVATEDVVFTFLCKGIPRTLTHQIVRHRDMVFGQQSLRVSEATDPIMLGEDYRKVLEGNPELSKHVEDLIWSLRRLYQRMIDEGVPREQSRAMMPMGITTKIIIKTDLRHLIDYFKARSSDITQYDHTHLVAKMALEVKTHQPRFYSFILSKAPNLNKIIDDYLIH